MFNKIPLFVKIILIIFFPLPALIIWIASKFLKPVGGHLKNAFVFSAEENKLFSALVNNPNEENARLYIEFMKNKPVLTLARDNHPSSWAVLREKWQIINHSNKIPTDMKRKIFDILTDQGLYVNSNIINNYKN